ncbi:MAG TPA: EamA family transporter [Gemmatimonadaceae bacterium]|nr:EamA family transporter [Gemmatimonadaceae bacterium]
MPKPSRGKLVAAFAAIYIIWGSTYLGILLAIQTIPPLLMAGTRFFIAGLILFALAKRGQYKPATLKQWRNAAIIGLLLLVGGNGAVVFSERMVPSGLAALLVAVVPIWVVLIDWARPRGKKPTLPIIGGLVLGVIGLLVLVNPFSSSSEIRFAGVILLMFGTVSWAGGSVLAQHIDLPKSAALATAIETLAAGVVYLTLSLIMQEPMHLDLASVSAKSIGGMIFLITFGSVVAFSAYVWLLKVSTPAKVSTYAYVNPVVALLLGWTFAGESLSIRTLVASAIIISAVALITVARSSA